MAPTDTLPMITPGTSEVSPFRLHGQRCLRNPSRPARLTLRGKYVELEPLSPGHAPALWPFAYGAPQTWTWLPLGPFPDYASFSVYLRFMSANREEIIWSVRQLGSHGTDARLAGWLGLLDIQPANATIELGNIWFPPPLCQTREATEALFLLLHEAFDSLNYQRVSWKCNSLHQASMSAAERLGFHYEGTLRAHMIVRGRRRDTAYFSILAEDWPERREAIHTWLSPNNFDETGRQINRLRRTT